MPKYTLERGGKTATVESPRDLTPEELTSISTQHFGAVEKPKHPWVETTEAAMRAKRDPGAPLFPASAGLGATAQEQAEKLQHPADLLATTAAGIASPALGLMWRVGAQAGAGAIKSAAKGENPLWGSFVDALVTGATEALLALIPGAARIPKLTRSVGEMAEKVRSTRAGEASVAPRVQEAIDLVKSKLPKGAWLNIPALDSTKKLTLDEATRLMKAPGLRDEQFQIAREQFKNELNRLDITRVTGPKPYAGSIFGKFAPKEHFQYRPTVAERVAEQVVKGTESPALRGLADTLTTTDVGGPGGTLPIGAIAPLAGWENLKGLAGRLMR
jgi:hypothetical protein